jgi:hypothetical protein
LQNPTALHTETTENLNSTNEIEERNGNTGEANGSQELTEEEIEEFIRNEQLAASEGNNADVDSKYTLQE